LLSLILRSFSFRYSLKVSRFCWCLSSI
jgi:hypothetical protein